DRVELRLSPRPRAQPAGDRKTRTAHDVVLLRIPPVVLLGCRAVEPDDALAVFMDELQQRGIRLGAEPDGLLVVAVSPLEDDDDDVVFVDDLGTEAARILDDTDAEAAGILEQRGQPLVVLAEAAELVVVLAGH